MLLLSPLARSNLFVELRSAARCSPGWGSLDASPAAHPPTSEHRWSLDDFVNLILEFSLGQLLTFWLEAFQNTSESLHVRTVVVSSL